MLFKESEHFQHVSPTGKTIPKPRIQREEKGHIHMAYDTGKHVSHNRNHTMPGVGRHS